MEPDNDTSTTAHRTGAANRTGRDAERARRLAQERLATAHQVAEAVAAYHDAADRIDAAQAELAAAGQARLHSLRQLRTCGLSVNEMVALTGLSSSRIQSLVSGK